MYSVELCAGAGGQAIGLEHAGFEHTALVEIDKHACATLRANRPSWNVVEGDLASFDGRPFLGAELLAGGLPCPPFSKAGKQLGAADERNLFPEAIRLADEIKPQAIMIENVRGLLDPVFADYRKWIAQELKKLGFDEPRWNLLQASDFGVPQLRPRVLMVALRKKFSGKFSWPSARKGSAPTVGEALRPLMAADGW
jgi:DNA (cytosine-5)-methyltransferase 1